MPEPVQTKRKRIILIYILGVVIPGIVLGYMAFMGIKGAEALREKQIRQELNLLAQDFFMELENDFSDFAIQEYADLIIEKKDTLSLLKANTLFLPDKFLKDKQTEHFGIYPGKAWELEFLDENLNAAEALLINQLKTENEPKEAVNILMSLARIRKKTGKTDEALETYQKIIDEYRTAQSGFMPASLAARLERAEILTNTLSELRNQEWHSLIQELLNPVSNYNENIFAIIFDEIEKNQDKFLSSDSLIYLIESERNRSSYLNKILNEAEDYLKIPTNQKIYLSSNLNRDLLIIVQADTARTKATLVDLYNYFDNQAISLKDQIDPDERLAWRIRDETGEIVFSQNAESLESAYPIGFPPPLSGWQLDLQFKESAFSSLNPSYGRGFYILMFALVILWLALGLIFTIYMINQEIKLSRMKSTFISNVSHEFKSPLTSIRHMSELLKLKRVRTEDKKDEFYDSMVDQCDHLGHLIENIMDFSKIEDEIKKFEFNPNDPLELVGNVVNTFNNRLSESGIEIKFESEPNIPNVNVDRDAIQQVVYNLLDNAYKYSDEPKKICCRLQVTGYRLIIVHA